MADSGSIQFTLRAVTKQFDAAMAKARSQLSDIQGELAGVGATAGLAFGGLAGAIGLATKEYSDHAERLNVIHIAFEEFADETKEWAQQFADATNRSSSELLGFAGNFQRILNPIMGGAEAAKDMSMQLTELAIDFGSLGNFTPTEAFEKLRSGITGESEPLKDLGIIMNDATLKAYALSQGIDKSVESMGAAEKTALRYQFIISQSGLAMGDAARTSDSLANMLVGLHGAVKDVSIQFGEVFEPFAKKAVGGLLDFLKEIRSMPAKTRAAIGGITAIAAGVAGFVATVAAAGIAIPAFVSGIGAIGTAMKAMAVLTSGAIVKLINFGAANTVANAGAPTLVVQLKSMGEAMKTFAVAAGAALSKLLAFVAAGAAIASIIGGIANISALVEARSAGRAAFDEQAKSMGLDPDAGLGTLIGQSFKANLNTGIDIMFGGISDAVVGAFEGLGERILLFTDKAAADTAVKVETKLKDKNGGSAFDFSKLDTDAMHASAGANLTEQQKRMFNMGRATRQEQLDKFSQVDPSRFTAGQQAMIGLDMAIGTISGKLGKAGEVMSSFAEGFSKGGIIGGVINAVASLLTETQFFQKVMDQVNRTIGRVVKLFDQILRPFGRIIEMIERFDEAGMKVIASIIDVVFRLVPLGPIIDGVVTVIEWFGTKVYELIDGIVDLINRLPGVNIKMGANPFEYTPPGEQSPAAQALGDVAAAAEETSKSFRQLVSVTGDLLDYMSIQTDATGISALSDTALMEVFDDLMARAEAAAAAGMTELAAVYKEGAVAVYDELAGRRSGLIDEGAGTLGTLTPEGMVVDNLKFIPALDTALAEMADALGLTTEEAVAAAEGLKEVEKSTDEVLNAPEGIKLALNRYRAIQRDGGAEAAMMAAAGAPASVLTEAGVPAGTTTIAVENMTVVAEDPEDMGTQIKEQASWDGIASGENTTAAVVNGDTASVPQPAPAPLPRAGRMGVGRGPSRRRG